MSGFRFSTRTLTTLAMLTALEIVLSRFLSLNAWNIKIGFNFVPVVAAAILYGPIGAGLVAALGDFLGALLFPIGTYFPGFTLTAFLTVAAVGINQLILSLFLNTLWISILYGSPYGPLLATRLVQCLILTAVQLIGIPLIAKGLSHTVRKGRTS